MDIRNESPLRRGVVLPEGPELVILEAIELLQRGTSATFNWHERAARCVEQLKEVAGA